MAKTKEELKKCPFCPDGEAEVRGGKAVWFSVKCKSCFGGTARRHRTRAKAITAWNHRPLEDELLAMLYLITILKDDCGKKMKEIAEQAIARNNNEHY